MEVERGVGDVVEAVGGGGQGGAGFDHQTHGAARQAAARRRVLERRRAVHVQPGEQVLQPHPPAEPRAEPPRRHWQTRAQRLHPVLRAQRGGAGLTWGGQDTGRVRDRAEEGLRVAGLRVVGGLWEAEGEVGGAGGRVGRSWISLDGQDLGRGTTGA